MSLSPSKKLCEFPLLSNHLNKHVLFYGVRLVWGNSLKTGTALYLWYYVGCFKRIPLFKKLQI